MAARAPIEAMPLTREARGAAARLLTDAFLDDPVWRCIGPGNRSYRRLVMRAWFPGALGLAHRWGGPSWMVRRDRRVVAVAVCFDEGRSAPAGLRPLYEAPLLLAGPGPIARGRRVQAIAHAHRPPEPHLYLWLLATAPAAQRTGAGRALLAMVSRHADLRGLPVYLETMNPDNLPYYRSAGYSVYGEAALPRQARVWFLERPAPGSGQPGP